ncbi:MAG: hypothetical protein DPW09_29715 [Anaerolineae bacterium]|nr:hypothetical protein [Anaerolineae bacterium]
MAYQYEAQLTEKAQGFIDQLRQTGIMAEITPGSIREFSLKISIRRGERSFGNVVLYYSPKNEHFSLKYHEMKDRSLEPELEAAWHSNADPTAPIPPTTTGVEIYVDGSFVDNAIGFGAVIVQNGTVIKELSGQVPTDDDPSLLQSHQVAGEIYGVQAAVAWCQENGITAVTIAYDYAGLEQWATGGWQAKQSLTRTYAEFIQNCGVDITWRKVTAHAGQRWNERADALARKAASLKTTAQPGADLPTEAKQTAQEFIAFLQAKGVTARCDDQIYNNQYARLRFFQQNAEFGQCDLYNTRKHRLTPRWQKFTDPAQQVQLETLWQEFRTAEAASAPASTGVTVQKSALSEVEYYYNILKPYADCAFDFIKLAEAIARAAANQPARIPSFDPEAARHDFEKLEAAYNTLRNNTHV